MALTTKGSKTPRHRVCSTRVVLRANIIRPGPQRNSLRSPPLPPPHIHSSPIPQLRLLTIIPSLRTWIRTTDIHAPLHHSASWTLRHSSLRLIRVMYRFIMFNFPILIRWSMVLQRVGPHFRIHVLTFFGTCRYTVCDKHDFI
jgi:hypothetical protein